MIINIYIYICKKNPKYSNMIYLSCPVLEMMISPINKGIKISPSTTTFFFTTGSEAQGFSVAEPREATGAGGDHETLVVEIQQKIHEALTCEWDGINEIRID